MAAFMSAPIYFTSKEGLLPIHDQFSLVNQLKTKHVSISFIYNAILLFTINGLIEKYKYPSSDSSPEAGG